MIDPRTIFARHRLAHEGLSMRRLATPLGINRQSVQTYLSDPHVKRLHFSRSSKRDPFKDEIERLLAIDPQVSAVVMRQRLAARGFDGGISMVRDDLRGIREATKARQPVIRFESAPGGQCQTDWGHCGSLA